MNLPLSLDSAPHALSFFVVAPMEGYQDRILVGDRDVLGNSNSFLEALYHNTDSVSGLALVKAFAFGGALAIAVIVPSALKDSTQRAGLYLSFGMRFPFSRDVRAREVGIAALLYVKRLLEFAFESSIDIHDGSRMLEEIRRDPRETYRRLRVVERGVELLLRTQQVRLRRAGRLWAGLLAFFRDRRSVAGLTLLLPSEPLSLEKALLVVARRCVQEWPAIGLLESEDAKRALDHSGRVVLLLALPPELLSSADSVHLVRDGG